jgi:AraC-like DNA-binding protein
MRRRGNEGRPQGDFFASRLFLKLFLSYASLVIAAFACYSAFVIWEGSIRAKADAARRSELKLEEFANAIESQLLDARNVASRVNSSPIIRDLYLNLKYAGRPADLSAPYRCIQELKSARATASNIGIYDILLFIQGHQRAYTSSDIIVLGKPFAYDASAGVTIGRGSLERSLGLEADKDIRLSKEYFVYGDDYSYDGAMPRGRIEVLFDIQGIEAALAPMRAGGASLAVREGDRVIAGDAGIAGRRLSKASVVAPAISYEFAKGEAAPGPALAAATAAALAIGLVVGMAFLLGAYYFCRSYYRPIGRIGALVGKGKGGYERLDEIATGVSSLVDESESIRQAERTARPFVRQAVLHALLTRDLEAEESGFLVRDSGIALDRGHYLVAACNIALRDGARKAGAGTAGAREIIVGTAGEFSRRGNEVFLYEEDDSNLALVIASDDEGDPEDIVCRMHERIAARSAGSPFIVTTGADETREDLARLPEAYRNARKALDCILLEGRGSLFFYEPGSRSRDGAYYFPADAQLGIMRYLSACDMGSISELLGEIYERNRSDSGPMGQGTRLMLYELYVVTVRALGRLRLLSSIPVNVDKTMSLTTLEEAMGYYREIYAEACDRLSESRGALRVDDEVIAFVEGNCFDPGLALKNVSERYGIGMKRGSALFQERFGMSFSRYVHSRRMDRAVELLKDQSISLESVGTLCGYSSNLTFRRHFQKEMGMNPSDYRKSLA